jgi:hypothetical protein
MTASTASGLTLSELQRILKQAEPAVLLVPPRILRRVIKNDRELIGLGFQVPHRKSYVVSREALLRIAGPDELGIAPGSDLPATLILLPVPYQATLESRPPAQTLLKYWRLLFHARVHLALVRRRAEGALTEAAVCQRIARIGPTEFDEARAVLRQEHFLLPPDDPEGVYEEFVALYLELRFFAPHRLAVYFPDVTDFEAIDRVLAEEVDAGAIFAATRLEGAPDPLLAAPQEQDDEAPEPVRAAAPPPPPDEATRRKLAGQADRAAARGNQVRAAILRQRALQGDAARQEIERLLTRLRQALELPESEVDAWRAPLLALVEPAAVGLWPIEARFLYDLQKVCGDWERDIYAVDLVEWIVSWGHRPIKRLLPNQPRILTVKHLHSALHRLTGVRIAEPLRLALVRLMVAAVHRAEQQLRERLRPVIRQALDQVDLRPENYAERVSRDKLIEELLDRVVERRFLSMGDLRDAVARNQLKLPDLSGPKEFLLGDKLIRANRQLADNLDGIYRRGEIYLRWLQRLSSMAFGTAVGRFLVLYFVLPFGGAYLSLEAVHHVIALFHHAPAPPAPAVRLDDLEGDPDEDVPPAAPPAVPTPVPKGGEGLSLVNPYSVAALGLFLFALMHVGWFRRGVVRALVEMWHAAWVVFYDWPAAFMRLPWVRRVLQSRPYLFFYQFVLKPLFWATLAALMCGLYGVGSAVTLFTVAAVFVAAGALLNSRLGLYLEEVCTARMVRTYELFRRDLIPGLFRLVMFVFKRLLGDVERVLYAVDELLRFRTGDNRFALVWKPALGLVWFCLTYVIRLVINLFVEPTFNPIKHFPVVTVTAKLIVPIIPQLTGLMVVALEPLVGRPIAFALAGVAIFLLPGLAGFLVWELKENWRLYRSNRPADLEPVLVGSHGETVVRFLRPGLHSGTVPKLYARLRRQWGARAHKQQEALHHVRERLRQFVERDLFAVLAGSKRWGGTRLEAGDIHLGTNRIRFELRCPAPANAPIHLDLAYRLGRLVAAITQPSGESWLAPLQPAQAAALEDALAGFYKLAGVEEVADPTPPGPPAFSEVPVAWTAWVQAWELDQAGKGHDLLLVRELRLLPRSRG